MHRDPDWLVTRAVDGGIVAVGMCGGLGGEAFVGWDDVRGAYPTVSGVGAFGRMRKLAKRLARNKVLKRIAKTAIVVAKMTPYGAAADQAIKIAKKATKLARGESDALDAAESMAKDYRRKMSKKATKLARGEVDPLDAAESMAKDYVRERFGDRGGRRMSRRGERSLRALISGD